MLGSCFHLRRLQQYRSVGGTRITVVTDLNSGADAEFFANRRQYNSNVLVAISPWLKTVRWTPFRILQTLIAVLVLLTMLVQMFSGITLSKYVFSFIHIDGLTSVARMMHMLGVYWGLVLISLHLGLHRHLVISKMKIKLKKSFKAKQIIFVAPSFILVAYGIYAFISRGLAEYMFLKNQFVFFDFTEPLILFFIDYLAIMTLFVFVGYYCSKLIMRLPSA